MQKSNFIKAGVPACILVVCFILSRMPNLALYVPEFVGMTALLTLMSIFAVYVAEKGWCRWSPVFIIVFAGVLRAMLLFRNPELSDDLFRYVFDGFMLMDGINPYASPPLAAAPANPDAAALVPFINHGHLVSIYPPAAQLIFACGAFAGGIFGMKLVLFLMDLATCGLILGILRRLSLSDTRLILYAWHPLALLEIGASGHIDGAAIFLTLLAIYLCLHLQDSDRFKNKTGKSVFKGRGSGVAFLAGACLAGAILVKWIPLLFFPGVIFLVPSRQRWVWLFGFAIAGILLVVPFWPEIKSAFVTLSVYLANWEFSGFFFRMLRRLTGSGITARLILAISGILFMALIYANSLFRISFKKPFLLFSTHPDFNNPLGVIHAFYGVVMVWLFITPTLHPWYGLYLVFLLPFAGGCAGMVLSWSVLLSYRVLIDYHFTGQWVENDLMPLLIMAGPVLAAVFCRFLPSFLLRRHQY